MGLGGGHRRTLGALVLLLAPPAGRVGERLTAHCRRSRSQECGEAETLALLSPLSREASVGLDDTASSYLELKNTNRRPECEGYRALCSPFWETSDHTARNLALTSQNDAMLAIEIFQRVRRRELPMKSKIVCDVDHTDHRGRIRSAVNDRIAIEPPTERARGTGCLPSLPAIRSGCKNEC